MPRLTKLALLALLAGCTTRDSRLATSLIDTLPGGIVAVHNLTPSGWTDSSGWRFEELTRLPTGDSGATVLVNPVFSAVMDAAGRAYVVDDSPTRIKVFDSAGTYLRTIGRDGAGPGEYRSPLLAIRGARLYVQDPRLRRLSIFDTAGSFISSFVTDGSFYGPGAISVDDKSRLYLRISAPETPQHAVTLLRYDTTGTLLDTLWLQQSHAPAVWVVERPNGRATYGIPGGPADLVTVTGSGALLRGWSAIYALALQTNGTDTTRVFTRSWAPIKVPESERTARFGKLTEVISRFLPADVIQANFHLYDMPTERPPMQALDLDATGRIWVRTASADTSASFYDVFRPEGIWQGTVRAPWPSSAHVLWRGTDRVLVREADSDGLASFVVYRLVKK